MMVESYIDSKLFYFYSFVMRKNKKQLLASLRHELANAIWKTSAYNVPPLCHRLGLEEGTEQEAFQSKYKYAERRLANLDGEAVLKVAQKLLTEEDHYKLGEVVELLYDLNKQNISELSRKNIIKLFSHNNLRRHSTITESSIFVPASV